MANKIAKLHAQVYMYVSYVVYLHAYCRYVRMLQCHVMSCDVCVYVKGLEVMFPWTCRQLSGKFL